MYKREGSIKGEGSVELEEFGFCCIVVWVFRHTL